jgi:hypothetical protein
MEAESFFEKLLNNEEESVKNDVKFLLDISYSVFFNEFDSPNGDQYIARLTPPQAEKLVKWFDNYYIPFYENLTEFEKCARLKKASDQIKSIKKLNKLGNLN